MIRLVVFDCDGTLIDSQHGIVEATKRAFAENRFPPPATEAMRRVVGLSLMEAMVVLLPDGSGEEHRALVREYRRAALLLRQRPGHDEPLYPGAADALDALDAAGYLLGIATGRSQQGLRATLARHGLDERFVTLQTADDAPSKPHPKMLERAIEEAGADETVFVGDTVFDMQMAANAGVAALGVGWGYHGADELRAAGARAVVESFADLPEAIAVLGT